MKSEFAVLALCVCASCWAQAPAPRAVEAADAAASAATGRGSEPKVQRSVIEDDGARIDELRVRGQSRNAIVRSKLVPGAPAYEIVNGSDGRDVTQDRRSEGRSLWQLFSF
jgi:hypothetical protein